MIGALVRQLLSATQPLGIILFSAVALTFEPAGTLLQALLIPCLIFILFCMGLHTGWHEFYQVVQQPSALWIGVCLQFLIMPALAFIIARLFSLSPELTTGLVLVGSAPGGLASNVLTFLAGGRVALSVSMTLVSSLIAIIATPWLTVLYLHTQVDITPRPMMLSLCKLILLPLSLGVLLHRYAPKLVKIIDPALSVLASLGICIAIAAVITTNKSNLQLIGLSLITATCLHNMAGLGSGWLLSRLCGHDRQTAITIAIEVGTQNTGLAMALAIKHFSAIAALPSIIFSFSQNILGVIPVFCGGISHTKAQKPIEKVAQDA